MVNMMTIKKRDNNTYLYRNMIVPADTTLEDLEKYEEETKNCGFGDKLVKLYHLKAALIGSSMRSFCETHMENIPIGCHFVISLEPNIPYKITKVTEHFFTIVNDEANVEKSEVTVGKVVTEDHEVILLKECV